MANAMKQEKKELAIKCLVDGNSIRATERIVGAHRDTIMRLMVRTGQNCKAMMSDLFKGLDSKRIQVDEIWSFVGKKQRQVRKRDNRNEVGDAWVFVALDADSKLVPTFKVGKRNLRTATDFLGDLSGRLNNRVQISSDMLNAYVEASERAFGGEVDYGQIVKSYEGEPIGPGRYSPPKVTGVKKNTVTGRPDEAHISTSYVERQNLTMRMCMRRFTRLTNGFSKKRVNHEAAVALHFAYYNLVRIHQTLRMTPAMAAGVTTRLWSIGDLID